MKSIKSSIRICCFLTVLGVLGMMPSAQGECVEFTSTHSSTDGIFQKKPMPSCCGTIDRCVLGGQMKSCTERVCMEDGGDIQ